MKKIIIPLIIIVVIAVTGFVIGGRGKSFDSSIATGCRVLEYTEQDGEGRLKIELTGGGKPQSLAVRDEELKKTLSESIPEEIIGVHIILHIPAEVVKEKHLDIKNTDSIGLLINSDDFDEYYEIVDISF